MVPGLKAYIIYECWIDNYDVVTWFYSRNAGYNLRTTADAKQIPERLRAGADRWTVYSAYLSGEDATALTLTFPQVVVREAKIEIDVRTLIRKVVDEISST